LLAATSPCVLGVPTSTLAFVPPVQRE